MSIGYKLAYRCGLTPWEKAGVGFGPQLAALLNRQDLKPGLPAKALDLGCGTGDHAIQLAQRGWQVTGVDFVGRAIDAAKKKASKAGVHVELLEGDVTALDENVGAGYQLILDVGCFHGLNPRQRIDYAREVTRVANHGASLLMFAFEPGRRGPLPRGVSPDEVERTLGQWRMADDQAADTSGMPGVLKKSNPRWFTLTRN